MVCYRLVATRSSLEILYGNYFILLISIVNNEIENKQYLVSFY